MALDLELQIREFQYDSDSAGLRDCVIEIQDFERRLEPRMPSGHVIVDDYISELFKRCEDHHGKILVAERDGSITGYVLVLCQVASDSIDDGDLEFALIGDLVVLAAYRQQGIGTRLLSAAERVARDFGAQWLRIEVLSANQSAIALYQSQGFGPLLIQLEKSLN